MRHHCLSLFPIVSRLGSCTYESCYIQHIVWGNRHCLAFSSVKLSISTLDVCLTLCFLQLAREKRLLINYTCRSGRTKGYLGRKFDIYQVPNEMQFDSSRGNVKFVIWLRAAWCTKRKRWLKVMQLKSSIATSRIGDWLSKPAKIKITSFVELCGNRYQN